MYVCVRVPDPLKLKLQTDVNCFVSLDLNLGPSEEQPVLLTRMAGIVPSV